MNFDVPIKQRLLSKAALAGIPVLGAFELTPRCNFQCKMCYVRLTPEEMRPLGRELTAEQVLAAIYNCKLDHCHQCKYLLHGEACMDELLDDAAGVIVRLNAALEAKEGKA